MHGATPHHSPFGHPSGVLGFLAGAVMAIENRTANRLVVEKLGLEPGDRILELGCGPGVAARAACHAVGAGGSVLAVDASTVMVRLARLLDRIGRRSGVEWQVGRAECVPCASRSVDVVLAINSWHHWTDSDAALAEIARVLRPGGRVVIAERTDASRHPGAHGLGEAALDELAARLRHAIGEVSVVRVDAGRDVLALVSATHHVRCGASTAATVEPGVVR